jgi:hypothetical protein
VFFMIGEFCKRSSDNGHLESRSPEDSRVGQ